MTTLSDQTRHPGFLQSGQLTLYGAAIIVHPNFRVELRALEPACTASYVLRLMSSVGRKADTAHGLKAVHA